MQRHQVTGMPSLDFVGSNKTKNLPAGCSEIEAVVNFPLASPGFFSNSQLKREI